MTTAAPAPVSAAAPGDGGVLVVRPDNMGDVLLSGPAVRAVAASGVPVTMAVSPRGHEAAERLPGVAGVVEVDLPWIAADPGRYDRSSHDRLVDTLASVGASEGIVLTSFHQSALPTAALLRLAGVERLTAVSEDYPGSLLDVRVPPPGRMHEVERMLAVVAAAGHRLPPGDDGRLRIRRRPRAEATRPPGRYVVVHPGASVPARTLPPDAWRAVVAALSAAGRVVVTGAGPDGEIVRAVVDRQSSTVVAAGPTSHEDLVELLAGASAVVVGNTGPAHLAAAVGTPVVSIFPPTVDPVAWHPWGVDHVLLGDLDLECAGCRSRVCPETEQRCLTGVTPDRVVEAVGLVGRPR
jgi:ADP-heptose:LPS heptosyltransferase